MPWTVETAGKHKKGMSRAQKHKWEKIANRVYKETGDEGMAIRIASGRVGRPRGRKKK